MAGNRWLVLISMTGSLSMIMLDQTVVSVALPAMTEDLSLSPTGTQWVINAYVLAMAGLVALGGRLGDRFGGVTTFRIGVLIFFLASVGCGLAPAGELGEPVVIAFRALQGAGAALMMPVSASIVIAAFPATERGRAMAVYAGISQIFLALGPLVGGLLTEGVSWRAVFWLNVPVGIAALILVQISRPANVKTPGGPIRPGDVILLVGGVTLTVLAVQEASRWSLTSPLTLSVLAVGVLFSILFVRAQLRSDSPLVNVRLLGRPPFLADNVVMFFVQFGMLPIVLFNSLYVQDLLGFSPIMAGLASLPIILPITVAAQIGGRWYDRFGVRRPVLIGLSICTVGLFGWAATLPLLSYPWLVPGMILTGFGLGLTISPTNTDALSRVSGAERAQGAGLVQTLRQLGGTLGVAIVSAVILGMESAGTQSPSPGRVASAIAVGFGIAALAFALALVVGWRLLSRERITAGEPVSTAPA
jgi:EmrB/QacA subfamily drug resistance transporter